MKLYPEYAHAWNALGDVAAEKPDAVLARECWSTAVEIDPKYLEMMAEATDAERVRREVLRLEQGLER
jgi:hypothetical protein